MRVAPLLMAAALVTGLAGPAHAADPVDYCGSPNTGMVRAIESGNCDPTTELSMGVGPIVRGSKRPTRLNRKLYNRYRVARAAARKRGYQMTITSGWRSLATQKRLYDSSVRRNGRSQRWVMPPRVSNHPWGLAIDVNYKRGKRKSAAWLERYGYKFGLCRAYQNEWWHFEPLTSPGTACPTPAPFPTW